MGDTVTTLSAAQVEFVEGPRSIYAASRNAQLLPSLSRVLCVRVAEDRRRLLLLVHPRHAATLLADVLACAELAVVFNAPESHQTLQLKGQARPVAVPADAEARIDAHLQAFAAVLQPAGFRLEHVETIVRGSREPPLALSLEVHHAYEQTPGPHAGQRLEASHDR